MKAIINLLNNAVSGMITPFSLIKLTWIKVAAISRDGSKQ